MVQLSRQAPVHDCGLLLQSMLHEAVVPQSTAHEDALSHWQLAPLHVPDVVVAVGLEEGGAGAPTAPPPGVPGGPDEQAQATIHEAMTKTLPKARKAIITAPVTRVAKAAAPARYTCPPVPGHRGQRPELRGRCRLDWAAIAGVARLTFLYGGSAARPTRRMG